MSYQIAKAGWFQRQSTILRRWKKSWVVLYQDGAIKYFESPDDHEAEDAKLMREVVKIKTALQVDDVNLPPASTIGCLMEIVFREGSWVLCAENADDASAWVMALEEARAASHVVPKPGLYPGQYPPQYPGQYPPQYPVQNPGMVLYPGEAPYSSQPPPYVAQDPNGRTTTIIYANEPQQYRRGYDGTDVALGAVGGMALGTMMWGPLLWW